MLYIVNTILTPKKLKGKYCCLGAFSTVMSWHVQSQKLQSLMPDKKVAENSDVVI